MGEPTVYADADEMSKRVWGLLRDAFDVEGEERVEVRFTPPRIITIHAPGGTFNLRVSRRRGHGWRGLPHPPSVDSREVPKEQYEAEVAAALAHPWEALSTDGRTE